MRKKNDLIIPLNEELMTEFAIQQLEERLETDPLLLGNPVDASVQLSSSTDCFTCHLCFTCEFSL